MNLKRLLPFFTAVVLIVITTASIEPGVYPVAGDCSKFVQIDNYGNQHVLSCPAGLVFNPAIGVCDWPHNVNCDNNQGYQESSNLSFYTIERTRSITRWMKVVGGVEKIYKFEVEGGVSFTDQDVWNCCMYGGGGCSTNNPYCD